ncbi:type II toxin-antitoxin system PemK/MazF family toxin [Cellulomonas sp. PhB150]|uniref:type II toxin-antitoxin system PemK/MazF family toxin n=1 Tax=Cellulomonas sp. PhB150 TaxID=2485188 RepID=UPI000F488861|nr:type II toxin-antitoxin system PemK/MazF family toxin [Cellulomonas sp. PhB150]ROS31054.1 PemK-like, MazF-like toxin of type II toxin-antitoxin system [Cellulomonas sp. PhB150]
MTTSDVRGLLRRALRRLRPGRTTAPARRGQPDFHGTVHLEYSPHADDAADPGEIVWTWVPYEEDPTQGKDRPVLVVGRDGAFVLALMLTSKDHTRDAAREARRGRHWMDIGTGPWDAKRRPSEVRLDRVLRLDPHGIRREGCIVDRPLFDSVVHAMAVIPRTT